MSTPSGPSTGRPHTVHWKAILREHNGNSLALPKPGNVHVVISDESDKAVFDKQMPLSADGDVSGDFDLPKDAALGYYSIRVGDQQDDQISGGFHVEDYRKPEYRVQVTAKREARAGRATMPVTIDSRYFFGEPVANATVKYRVYQEPHYWWGEDEDDSTGDARQLRRRFRQRGLTMRATRKRRRPASWMRTARW